MVDDAADSPAAGDATADQLATEHAQHGLGQLLDDLRGLGADAEGDLGDPVTTITTGRVL